MTGIATPTIPPGDPVRGQVAALMGDLPATVRGHSNSPNGTWYWVLVDIKKKYQYTLNPYPARPKLPPSSRVPGEFEVCVTRKARLGGNRDTHGQLLWSSCGHRIPAGRHGEQTAMRSTSLEQRERLGTSSQPSTGWMCGHFLFMALSLMVNCEGNFLYLAFCTVERGGPVGPRSALCTQSAHREVSR